MAMAVNEAVWIAPIMINERKNRVFSVKFIARVSRFVRFGKERRLD